MESSRFEAAGTPTGLLRFGFRAPIALYRARLGFLLGTRFLLLEHRGRHTGKTRRAVLEVVAKRADAFYVGSPWKSKAQWFRNIEADPHVVVHCGFERFNTIAHVAETALALSVYEEHATKHPRFFWKLASFMLDDPGNSTDENVERAANTIPLVELPRPD